MNESVIIKRNKKRSATASLLDYIIYSIGGGPTKLSESLTQEFNVEITDDRILLWRLRGEVALVWSKRVAEFLKVSPYLLNYRGFCVFTGKAPDWEGLVKDCASISTAQKKDVLKKKAPEVCENYRS